MSAQPFPVIPVISKLICKDGELELPEGISLFSDGYGFTKFPLFDSQTNEQTDESVSWFIAEKDGKKHAIGFTYKSEDGCADIETAKRHLAAFQDYLSKQ